MDLTTTNKIQRRVLDIFPSNNKAKYTPCNITTANWIRNRQADNIKVRIASFYVQNQSIPCFIPKYCKSIITNAEAGQTINWTFNGDAFNSNTLDYFIGVEVGGNITASYVFMQSALSEDPQLLPLGRQPEINFYSNRYYWFYDTEKFCQLVSQTLVAALSGGLTAPVATDIIEIIKTNDGYKLVISESYITANTPFNIVISKTLYDLFKFPVTKLTDQLYKLNFNTVSEIYGVQPVATIYTRYVPDTWFPWDLIVFKTDLNIEREKIYNTNDYTSRDSDNIMLSYKLVNNNPDGIYNFFSSELNPNSGWITFGGVTTSENIKFEIALRLKYTNSFVDYTILQDEKAYMVVEQIETE